MSLLLHTHAFLWWMADDPRLGSVARAEIAKPVNSVYVSAAVAWEIAVKRAAGRLRAPGRIDQWIADEGFLALAVEVAHAVESAELPPHHRDPFDRMLVAQARLENLTIVARDPEIEKYDVEILDAGR